MENQQIGGQGVLAQDFNATFAKQQAAQLYYLPARVHPRSLMIEELDGGFVVTTYDTKGNADRFVAHNARVLGRKLKAWADPTPAVPPAAT